MDETHGADVDQTRVPAPNLAEMIRAAPAYPPTYEQEIYTYC